MEGDAPTGMSEAPGNSATAAPTGPAAAPATPRPQSALHLGDARRSILEIRESSDGRSSGSFENLTGTASSSPTTEAATKRARKATVAADEPMGRSGVETDQEGGDEADEEPRFTKVRRVLFRASDLLPSSPAARSGSRARADEEDIGSDDAGLEAEVWTPSPGEDGTASADGLQALFPTTQLCFDDEVGPGRIWTPVNLRGDADPHWREVPHNPDHPPVPGEGTCHLSDLTQPDSSLPAIIHEHTARLAAEGTLFEATINNLAWATSLIDNSGYDFDAGPAQLKIPKALRQRLESRPYVFPTTGANPFMGERLASCWGYDPREMLRPSGEMNELREDVDVPDALPFSIFGGAEFKRRDNALLISSHWKGEVTPVEELGKGLVEFPRSGGKMDKGDVAEENQEGEGGGDGDGGQQQDKDGEKVDGRPSTATALVEREAEADEETERETPED